MATANTSDIANSQKSQQDNEAKNRGDVETVPAQRADDGQIEDQSQQRGESQQQPERVVVEAPPEPTRLSREDIYKRFSEKRKEEAIETDGYSPTTPPPFLAKDTPSGVIDGDEDQDDGNTPAGEEVKTAAEAKPAGEAPKKFKLKVRGNEFEVTREHLLQAAGLTPEEAEGVPEMSLVRAAQINSAAESYLDGAKETSRNARVRKATQGDDDDNEPEARQPDPQPTQKEAVKKVVEAIQFGDPDEAADLLDGLIADRADERLRTSDQQRSSHNDRQRVLKAEADWNKANPEFSDPAVSAAHSAYFLEGAANELAAKTGLVTPEIAQHLRQNPEILAEAYKRGMQSGFDLKPVETLMAEAGDRTIKRFNIQRPDPASQRAQEPPARQQSAESRADLKRKLAATPERSGGQEPASQNQAPAQSSASQVIRDMRKARGQPVAG